MRLLMTNPQALRITMVVVLFPAAFFFGLRWLEHAMTYHPAGYNPSPIWTPPQGATDVWFGAPGKERLHGWFFRSTQQPAAATILHCHGNGGNLTNVGWVAKALAARGYDVLVFDYRGYGRSEGELSDERGLFSDGDAAYDYLVGERGVKPESLILYGQSLGTAVAIDIAARRPAAMLIVESGLSSASDMAATVFPWLPRSLHRLAKNRFESARKLRDVHCPVLVTHGEKDQTIPPELGRKLFEAANEPKRLEMIAGGDHNLSGNGGQAYLDRVAAFIETVLLERQSVLEDNRSSKPSEETPPRSFAARRTTPYSVARSPPRASRY